MTKSRKARVTVVMPTYRHGDHLKDALRSMDEQTYQDFELIVVNDGDPDPRVDLLTEGRFRVKHEVNQGTAIAVNSGLSCAYGTDYMTWVQSDCIYNKSWLATLMGHLDSYPGIGLVYSSWTWQPGSFEDDVWVPQASKLMQQGDYVKDSLIKSAMCFVGPSFLFRKKVWEDAGEQEGAEAHDYKWFLRAEEVCNFSWVASDLCTYRVHPERATARLGSRELTMQAEGYRQEALKRRST